MVSLLSINDLSVDYDTGDVKQKAVDGVSLEIPSQGHALGIVGESGSGKTTLGMCIMNLIEPPGKITSGRVEYMGADVLGMKSGELRKYRWGEVSMVYQSAMNSLSPVKTISDHIIEVIREHKKASKIDARNKAVELLSKVGIKSERVDDFPHQLSGGMRQRVVIAMALVLSPKILIADEPTSALDVVVQRQILSLLKEEAVENNLSLIFITHELAILSGMVDEVAVMHDGRIVEKGPIDKTLFEPEHPYTMMLVNSLLTLDSSPEALSSS